MSYLRRLGSEFRISLPTDEDGFAGRECPACEGYFKIRVGTGLTGLNLPCHCPYCGHTSGHSEFLTPEQIEHAKSVAGGLVMEAVLKDLKALEFDYRPPRGSFGIGISMKVEGRLRPNHYYREKQLETEIVCGRCTLRYAIYGVFAHCPDCGVHNSLQILGKNLDLAEKQIALAGTLGGDLVDSLIADALENAVSSFDGFGRETCRVNAARASDPVVAESLSLQNLARAHQRLRELFGFDLSAAVDSQEWTFTLRCFEKRHVLAHRMGVVDEAYLQATNDPGLSSAARYRSNLTR
jgi:hypothetical protein